MTIEDKLKSLILSKYNSVLEFTQTIGLPYSTMTSLFRRGVHHTSVTTIIKVCQALGISADELANDRIVPISQEASDIADAREIIASARLSILTADLLILDGQYMTEDSKMLLADALDLCLNLAKRMQDRQEET